MDTRTLKKIYNKLSQEDKTELKSEKVELGNMTALQGAILILREFENNAEPFVDDFTNKVAESIDAYQKMMKYRNQIYNYTEREVNGILRTFEKNAEDIGIQAESISEYKEVKKLQDKAKQVYRLLDGFQEPKSQ